jgi:tRNA-dihydrouridine synthase
VRVTKSRSPMYTSDANVLAPMVRLGTLPLRLLSLERGAALVYTEEIIDAKLANAQRTVDSRLGTVDWRIGSGIILRTCQAEHNKLVVQLGTAEVSTALKAISALKFDPANPLRDGIIGIDINMGCPKHSAEAGGSGGALFADAARAEGIVGAIRKALPAQIRLSCKVRLHHHGPEETIRRCLRLVEAGATAIAVHGRYATERSCDLARWQELAVVAAALKERRVDVLLNGDVLDATAAASLRHLVPDCKLMIGRGALHAANGVFASGRDEAPESQAELLPGLTSDGTADGNSSSGPSNDALVDEAFLDEATLNLCSRYAKLAIQVENPPLNTAFVLQWMLHARLRERRLAVAVQPQQQPAHQEGTARKVTVDSAVMALRGATTMLAIASALDLMGFLDSSPRGMPAAPTHRYTPTYFQDLETISDWARAPSRAALNEAHAAEKAPLVTNLDFRRLVQSRAALAANRSRSSSGAGVGLAGVASVTAANGSAVTSVAEAAEEAAEEDAHTKLVRTVGSNAHVKYFVIEETAPSAKALGYFAAAWRCRAVVDGRSFDGALRKSRSKAEQHAAQLAIEGLAASPLDPAKAKRRAKRDGQRKRKRH